MKNVDIESLVRQAVPVPVLTTRKEKLKYAASLIRKLPENGYLYLYHNLEHISIDRLKDAKLKDMEESFFSIVGNDPLLREAGVGDNVHSMMGFFEITQDELHEFSCDCGGAIKNSDMVKRIEKLAEPRFLARLFNW